MLDDDGQRASYWPAHQSYRMPASPVELLATGRGKQLALARNPLVLGRLGAAELLDRGESFWTCSAGLILSSDVEERRRNLHRASRQMSCAL
jgi:hypothetical protein